MGFFVEVLVKFWPKWLLQRSDEDSIQINSHLKWHMGSCVYGKYTLSFTRQHREKIWKWFSHLAIANKISGSIFMFVFILSLKEVNDMFAERQFPGTSVWMELIDSCWDWLWQNSRLHYSHSSADLTVETKWIWERSQYTVSSRPNSKSWTSYSNLCKILLCKNVFLLNDQS